MEVCVKLSVENIFTAHKLKNQEIYLCLIQTTEGQPKKEGLPAYHFHICLLDGRKIGECNLRVGHNDKTYLGGNIGYQIDENFRGHHYATKACKLLFALAREHELGYLIITCEPNNIASLRTCERLGGTFLEIADIPETSDMYQAGIRKVNVYRFVL